MHGITILITGGVLLWAGLGVASAHQATEIYIPLGQSPGISNTLTDVGTIDLVNAGTRTITVDSRSVAITDDTNIYLDRSLLKQQSLNGDFADLQAGRTVEVRYRDPARRRIARWVKVQLRP